jgi:Sec-independent protein translocase protein TatA
MRSMGRSDGLGWGSWLLILVVVLILVGAVALAVYGGSIRPAQHEVEQVLANDRFPS